MGDNLIFLSRSFLSRTINLITILLFHFYENIILFMNKVIWFKWITSTWNVVHSRGTWSYRWRKAGLDSSSMRSAERRDRLPQCRRRSLACAGVAWGCRPQLCSNHSLPQTWDWSVTDCRCAPAVCEALIVTTNLKHHINTFSTNIIYFTCLLLIHPLLFIVHPNSEP